MHQSGHLPLLDREIRARGTGRKEFCVGVEIWA